MRFSWKKFNNRSFLLAQMSLDAYLGIFSVIPDHSPLFLGHCFWRTCTHLKEQKGWRRMLKAVLEKVKKMKVLDSQLCLSLCGPTACSLPGPSVQGILQARTLEWVAIPFSRGAYPPRDWTPVSITGRFFTNWATKEAPSINVYSLN